MNAMLPFIAVPNHDSQARNTNLAGFDSHRDHLSYQSTGKLPKRAFDALRREKRVESAQDASPTVVKVV